VKGVLDSLEAFQSILEPTFPEARVLRFQQLAGGASKEAWAIDLETAQGTREVLMRRAGGGAMNLEQLTLEQEFQVIQAARDAGVTVAEPIAYLPDALGREAFISARLHGEAVGRRVVSRPEFSAARAALPERMASELARIHSVPLEGLAFLPGSRVESGARHSIERLYNELDSVGEPHPVIELALLWLRQHEPPSSGFTLVHGDFRIGNLMISETDLIGVLDWEFAHVGDPAEDLAWTLIRAWRFGQDDKRLGGIADVTHYLETYNALTGRGITLETLFYWEVMGNVKWAVGALTQAKRHLDHLERSVELAVLGRLSAEMEYELLRMLEA
jgi:aminoglycoside phosphotransferase (APT) family kinase protein